jgi:pathogenesis-related protein 1
MPRSHSFGPATAATIGLFAVLAVLTAACSTTGNDGGSTDRDSTLASSADEIVAAHNAVRAQVTEPPDYQGAWEPLPPVSWSDTVAASAQGWADHLRAAAHCGLQHDTNSGYGENLAAGTNLTPSAAVAMWAEEKSQYTYNPRYEFVAGHYTQIIWRSSVEIGCGAASCDARTVIVCRYSPPGNVIGQQPY